MRNNWKTRKETTTVTNLGRLLARMTEDWDLHRRFLDHTDQVIAGAGLSIEEKKALRAGDWPSIRRLLGPQVAEPRPMVQEPPSGG